jgi:hypothetical protein
MYAGGEDKNRGICRVTIFTTVFVQFNNKANSIIVIDVEVLS